MPRKTDDPKGSNIKFRANEEMRKYIDKISQKRNISISDYIRDLIKKDMKHSKE